MALFHLDQQINTFGVSTCDLISGAHSLLTFHGGIRTTRKMFLSHLLVHGQEVTFLLKLQFYFTSAHVKQTPITGFTGRREVGCI